MVIFLIGLSLGTCIGAAALGICTTSYEHEMGIDDLRQGGAPDSRL